MENKKFRYTCSECKKDVYSQIEHSHIDTNSGKTQLLCDTCYNNITHKTSSNKDNNIEKKEKQIIKIEGGKNMKTTGIIKLRLAVTFLFILMAGYLFIIMSSGDIDLDAEEEFYISLSDEQINTLEDIYSTFPDTGTDSNYQLAYYLGLIIAGGLFILMIKVWTIKRID